MIQSMTGYGKAECTYENRKFTVEIRSLNGKTCDLSLKTQIIPREKELEVRQLIQQSLIRGNIDVFVNAEYIENTESKEINRELLLDYYRQIQEIRHSSELSECSDSDLLSTLLRMPDIVDNKKDEMTPECWDALYKCIKDALSALISFRVKEGAILKVDVGPRADLICSFVSEVEKYEKERTDSVREKLISRIKEIGANPDQNRLEQEIIFYIEKLDINEEKVRLRQHCRYFLETMEKEEYPGKKLGFIAQEMGREINTMGSKANHAEIQKWVVKMKDELEKIKEQSLNIL